MSALNPTTARIAAHLASKGLRSGDLVLIRSQSDRREPTIAREAAGELIERETGARCVPLWFDEHDCAVIYKPDLRRVGILVAPRGDGLVPHHEIPGLVLRVPSAQPVLPPKAVECACRGISLGSPLVVVGAIVACAVGVVLQRSGLLWWL